ncbi:MAG TPA: nitroreductase family protein [bacterium]|nr:nitroreductase family protein [bacterium]
MPRFSIRIDAEKCTRCGLCVKDCVSGCIQLENDAPVPRHPEWCNLCSHCVAVCPAGAVEHGGLSGQGTRPIERKRLDPECYREIALTRRSVRHYKDEPVDRELIAEILDLAAYSPTASNTMDVGYTVITDREAIARTAASVFRTSLKLRAALDKPWGKALFWIINRANPTGNLGLYLERLDMYKSWTESGRDLVLHHAPALILIHGPKKGRFVRENCAIASTNIINYAHAKGLGTCYIGFMSLAMDWNKKLAPRLGVPPGRKPYLALALGRPAIKYSNTPIRPPATVTWYNGP